MSPASDSRSSSSEVVSDQSTSCTSPVRDSGRRISAFLAVQGMTETTASLLPSGRLPGRACHARITAPSICWGERQVEMWGAKRGQFSSQYFTQAGQQLVSRGSFSPAVRRVRNSSASSTTVRSALYTVSYTRSKPSCFKAPMRRGMELSPLGKPR